MRWRTSIAAVGEALGSLLGQAGHSDATIPVLREAVAACRKLGREDKALALEAEIARIESGG